MPSKETSLVPVTIIERRIYLIRRQKVMLDFHLAELYGVGTKALNQAVRRNLSRFPEDFAFRLNKAEVDELNRSQIVTGSQKHRDPRFSPYAFTQEGVAMLSSVLKSARAVHVNVAIMRTFVRLRELLASNRHLAQKLEAMERKYDARFRIVFEVIQKLMAPLESPKEPIGFGVTSSPQKKPPPRK